MVAGDKSITAAIATDSELTLTHQRPGDAAASCKYERYLFVKAGSEVGDEMPSAYRSVVVPGVGQTALGARWALRLRVWSLADVDRRHLISALSALLQARQEGDYAARTQFPSRQGLALTIIFPSNFPFLASTT